MKVGDTFQQTLDIPGQRVELLCEVVELEENERLSFEYCSSIPGINSSSGSASSSSPSTAAQGL
jgi:hypothetical protein